MRVHAAAEIPSFALTEHMLQEDTVMGSAGSARPADPQSESSEDSDPEPESGKQFACILLFVWSLQLHHSHQ